MVHKEDRMAKDMAEKTRKELRTEHEPRNPSRDEIARRAYDLYQERGAAPGGEVDDWLRAEQELREKQPL
jgi:DUF2934 family protein